MSKLNEQGLAILVEEINKSINIKLNALRSSSFPNTSPNSSYIKTIDSWIFEDGKYKSVIKHPLNSKNIIVSAINTLTNDRVFIHDRVIDLDTIEIESVVEEEITVMMVNANAGTSVIEIPFKDEEVSDISTWSSKKIKEEIDNKTVDLTPITNELDKVASDLNEVTNDLSKVDNTKYATTNGIKEFECKDGYVDNVYMEGETLVNILSRKYEFSQHGDDSMKFLWIQTKSITNGTYTIIATKDISNLGFQIKDCETDADISSYQLFNVDGTYAPYFVINIPQGQYLATFYSRGIFDTFEDFSNYINSKLIILEGDHTDKDISYFEGLKSVGQGDKIEVLAYNKANNLIEDTFTYTKDMVINYINGELRSATGHYACDNYIEIEPSTDYMFIGINGNRAYYDENKQVVPPINNSYLQVLLDKTNGIKKNFAVEKSPSNARYIKITIHKDNLVGGKAYLYKSSNYDHKQISTTLRSLPNGVKDTIEKRGNKYVKVQRCGEVTLNGSENWVTDLTGEQVYTMRFKINNSPLRKNSMISDKIIKRTTAHTDTEYIYYFNDSDRFINSFFINITRSKLSTEDVNGFKKWLKANPLTVVYELETPQVIELPNFNPQTYSDSTTLLLNTGVIQGECNFEVTNSKGSEIEVLKEKVSDINDTSFDNKKTLNDLLSAEKGSFVRSYECSKNISTANKWFTIFESAVMPDSQFTDFNLSGATYILTVNRSYVSPSNESYVFLINCVHERVNITQLSGTTQGQLLQKIRLVTRTPNKTFKIEIYIKDNPAYENFWAAKIIPISKSNDLYVNLNPRNFIESDNLGVTRKEYTVTPNGVVTFGLEEIQTLQLENEELKKQNNLILSNQRAILAGDMQTLAYNLYPEDFDK